LEVVVLQVETVVSCVLVGLVLDTIHHVEEAVKFPSVVAVVSVILPAS
jgi:hypothetical protein